ncbi:MAG: thymidylate synthase [Dehalococcoidia bacterium]|nr:thymidylate synthase [Dehalococcoidia bacterium]
MTEKFSPEEQRVVARHFSNTDSPVFVLTELPEMVKGALFARYSRSPKTLRRLFLDEFQDGVDSDGQAPVVGLTRAADLYERIFIEYGDDSVAQLAGVHVAVEGASNILTKVIERGRLMSYLEQSTRYMPYNDKPDGHWRYHVPAELMGAHRTRFTAAADQAFELYTKLFEPLQAHLRGQYPQPYGSSAGAYRMSIRAKACDILRGLLPAATTSNLGIYGSAQGYEALLLRLLSHELAEARGVGVAMLAELKKVVPVFVERVERPDRGGVFIDYLRNTRERARSLVRETAREVETAESPLVSLTDFEPDGETKVAASILFELSSLSDEAAMNAARELSPSRRAELIATYADDRRNRRHKPGRAFERTSYRFEIVGDYGAFRDLQRHRLLTIEWQTLNPHLGFDLPPEIPEIGAQQDWTALMQECSAAYQELRAATSEAVAQYIVPMAYKIRFSMEMNAREAMHLIELRTTEQAHRNYRSICLAMHGLIAGEAGHQAIAAAMNFVGSGDSGLERLGSEQRIEEKRSALAARRDR